VREVMFALYDRYELRQSQRSSGSGTVHHGASSRLLPNTQPNSSPRQPT
jgi:hypothetical protein